MSNFYLFQQAVHNQFTKLTTARNLYVTDVTQDESWNMYLNSFPEGTNILTTVQKAPGESNRLEHDCNCCKQFIRAVANVVMVCDTGNGNTTLTSVWDIEDNPNVPDYYKTVAGALHKLVTSRPIKDVFIHYGNKVGTESNTVLLHGKPVTWNHFYFNLPAAFVMPEDQIPTKLSNYRSSKQVFTRGLKEFTPEAFTTALDLIAQNSLYRGEEFKGKIKKFQSLQAKYSTLDSKASKDNWAWVNSVSNPAVTRLRNSSIGTLLVDLSTGKDLENAVATYESKVAPQNYKRTTALITPSMIKAAQKYMYDEGYISALPRRYAKQDDISINNVLYADRTTQLNMKDADVFDTLITEASSKVSITPKSLDKIEEVPIAEFIKNTVPTATKLEVMLENKHTTNLVSLIAPVDHTSRRMFQWDNRYSWAYAGEVADSMKEHVRKAGGNVTGVLRFSILWNDGDNNQNDFDAHCEEPNGNIIYYSNAKRIQVSSGVLDVDITTPGRKVAVENITYSSLDKMQPGNHNFLVHNYSHAGGMTGFTAEIEFEGQVFSYKYDQNIPQGKKIAVASVHFDKKAKKFSIKHILKASVEQRTQWGLTTNQFHTVSMLMNSPNHWDGQEAGNKHWFFMLNKCKNDSDARGFFNEFLKSDLAAYRKQFEVLGSKLRAAYSDDQLSGLGFSSTKRNSLICRVSGTRNQVVRVLF